MGERRGRRTKWARSARRAALLAAGALGSLGALGCGSGAVSSGSPRTEAKAPPRRGPVPGWLPAYTDAQKALLRPADGVVPVPAPRVYPDLRRFGYADPRPIEDPREGLRFTRLVAQQLEESPRLYALGEAEPDLANLVAQYGPPGPKFPDLWLEPTAAGSGRRLVPVRLPADVKELVKRGEAKLRAGDARGAAFLFEAAAKKAPSSAGLRVLLGDALVASGDASGAQAAYEASVRLDPTLATGHAGLAEVFLKAGEGQKARRHVAEALAYHPNMTRALALAEALAPGGSPEGRTPPPRVFLEVDSHGAIRVASPPKGPHQMYGACRAVMRYEPDLRAAIFDEPPSTPYYLSALEEVVCLEAAIGAYLVDKLEAMSSGAESGAAPEDEAMERLMRIGHTEGLLGYAMFEILGQHRPERARTAPADVHRAMVDYVERHLLGGSDEDLPEGVYTAGTPAPPPLAAR